MCRRLGGIPLAIELAAARVGSSTVAAIAQRLDERFQLLTGGPRDVLPRQQTLRATLDWSWELLNAREQALLGQLSVFVGGWTLEAVQAVSAGDGDNNDMELDLLDLLDLLVRKSLVEVDETGAVARYGLLETVRHYAAERLTSAEESTAARDRHLAWYLTLAEEAAPQLIGPAQGPWLERLEREHDNLRAALAWARESGEGEQGLRLAVALCWFWLVRGHLSEGRRLLQVALTGTDSAPTALRASALHGAGNLAVEQGEYGQAGTLFEEALALRRALGHKQGMAASLANLGVVTDRQGEYGRAATLLEESLALARQLGNRGLIANSLGNLGSALGHQGEYGREAALYEEALTLFRDLGNRHSIAVALDNLGLVSFRLGEYERATTLFEEALTLFRDQDDKHGVAGSLINLGAVAERQGDYARAIVLSAESLQLSGVIGAREQAVEGMEIMALVAVALGQPRRAARLWGTTAALREALGVPLRPDQRTTQDQAVQAMRSILSEHDFEAAWAAGRVLQLEEAITFALKDEPAAL